MNRSNENKIPLIIFDTDMDTDCDDVGGEIKTGDRFPETLPLGHPLRVSYEMWSHMEGK
ncbi:MAG: hypothetical protein IJY22_04980 [Clostridia bacterium]|nr:hypothetical protein [Clostridia bacterium]